jgi:ABC-type antimicrobial peptide transport system permease subunit
MLVDPLKEAVRRLDANMPVSDVRTYEDVYRYNTIEGPGIGIKIVATMGGVGLMLAVAGLYGLVAYTVGRRTREIGIRIAMGATRRDVLRLVMRRGLTLVAIGTAVGTVMGLGLERVLNAFLFNAGGVDLLVYATVVPALLMVTILATYLPARRAARISPTQALRYDA